MRINHSLIAISILNVCLLASHAQPAFQPSAAPAIEIGDFACNLGMVFTPNADITVSALGFYNMNTTNGDEQVAIFDTNGTVILAQVDVTTSDPLAYGYFWATITPVVLLAGQQYTVDGYTGNYGGDYDSEATPIVDPQITYIGHTYDYTTNLAFPDNTGEEASDAYYGPNIFIGSFSAPNGGPLTITRSGNNVVLTWSTSAVGFTLQSAPNLSPQAVWSGNLPSPVVVNGQNAVTTPITGTAQFYRLSQ
jgi:hypothetical protein